MEGSQETPAASALTAPLTNALACLWGAAAAYILCCSLLITHRYGYALAALVPLIAAWATLERKRWGRMALTGLSMITACPFIFLLAEFAALHSQAQPKKFTLGSGVRDIAALYDISATAGFGLVVLAVVTWLWMLRRQVKNEFNQHKKNTLANAQRAIATVLVCCWGGAVALTPLVTGGRDSDSNGRPTAASPRHGGRGHGYTSGHRVTRRTPAP